MQKNLNNQLIKILEKLEIGNHSQPIQIPRGLLILKVENIKNETGENKCKLGWYLDTVGVRVRFKGTLWFASSVFLREPHINEDIWYKEARK